MDAEKVEKKAVRGKTKAQKSKKAEEKTGTGRPSKYESQVKPRLLEIEGWCRDGATDEIIAKNLHISLSTLGEYKKKFPEFSEAIKNTKDVADIKVENALFQRAIGYNAKVVKHVKVKRVDFDPETGRKTGEHEELVPVEDEVHIPADTTAQIYWLNNRKKEVWKQKQEVDHQGGMDVKVEFAKPEMDEMGK